MYRGKDEQHPINITATMWWPIVKLTEDPMYHRKEHLMALDNWYTSIDAVKRLKDSPLYMDVVGTVRANKRGLPADCIYKATGPQVKPPGTVKCKEHDSKQIYFTAWQDSKPVHFLSTWPTTKYNVKRNSVDANGRYQPVQISRPTIIGVYNDSMDGTDKFDQWTSYYDDRFRSTTWQLRIYFHFLQASVVNAHILFNLSKKTSLTLLEYRRLLIHEMLDIPLNENIKLSRHLRYSDSNDDSQNTSDSEEEESLQPVARVTATESKYAGNHRDWWIKYPELRLQGHHSPIQCISTASTATHPLQRPLSVDNVVWDYILVQLTSSDVGKYFMSMKCFRSHMLCNNVFLNSI
jgi:hypothetical protein